MPAPLVERVIATYGKFVAGLSPISPEKGARDVLDEDKVHEQVAVFCRTFGLIPSSLRGLRLLEVGSGLGIFIAVLRRDYGVEAFGIEPASAGFETSFQLAREILLSYGVDPSCVTEAVGEDIPFPNHSFDLVFSSTVLEHTHDPALVLAEAIRVLKPGGCMQFVFPNYGAFFEGHYVIPWIPYLPRWLGKIWTRLWGRDPAFMATLQLTNYYKTRTWLRDHRDIRVVTYGEEIFRERMLGAGVRDWAGLGRLKGWVDTARKLHLVPVLTWLFLRVKSFDPIILSLVRTPLPPAAPLPDNRAIYEKNWADWTDMKTHGPSSRWLRALVGDHLGAASRQCPIPRLLDFGCGEGTTTDFIARMLPRTRVLGVDRSAAGVACASSRPHRPNLSYQCHDDCSHIPDGSFEFVTCFEVLEHVDDWRAITRELARLSTRFVLVSFPTGRMRPCEVNVGHLRNFRSGQFERYAATIGLVPASVFYAGFPFYLPIFRDLCNAVNSGGTPLTKGHYAWWQKRLGDLIFFCFRFLSTRRRHGDQFCGLFVKNTP